MFIGTNYYNSLYYNSLNSVFGKPVNNQSSAQGGILGLGNNSKDYFNTNALKYVQNIKSGSAAVKNSLSALTGGSAFKQATASAKGNDKDLPLSRVQDLANSYNELYAATLDNPNDLKTNRLFTQLVSNSKTYASALGNIGIGFDKNGYMTVDKDLVNKAAEDGRLEKFFTENHNASYGFANQLYRIADDANRNTGKYISPSTIASSLMNDFTDYYGFYKSMSYNNYNTVGLLFDLWY